VIGLRDVRVSYGDRAALDGVTLGVADGEWLGVIGPNGAGKTTLLRAIAGLAIAEGTIAIGGKPAARLRRREHARLVALVPQRPLVPAGMTVADYVLTGRSPYIGLFDMESRSDLAIVAGILDRLGIAAFAGRALGSMSGGEQQRVILARALAQQAPVLLLDEGTSALDVGSQQEVLELVDGLRRSDGLTVVSAMHDLTLAGLYADRLALLAGGVVVANGSPHEILTEQLVRAHYRADVRIHRAPDGTVAVLPQRGGTT